MSKENCPRHVPNKELESHYPPCYGGACKRDRNKALKEKCISEDVFKMMEFCNLVPRCFSSGHRTYGCFSPPCSDVALRSWSFCEESPILSMASPFAECEKCMDCDFVKNCALMEGSYFKDLPFEMDFTVRYQFQCKTDLGIPVNNIGLKTENGFMPFEQTLDGTMMLTGKKYINLADLNPIFTRDARLDVNCELQFWEPIRKSLSLRSKENLERNWDDLHHYSGTLALLRSADFAIVRAVRFKGTNGFEPANVLANVRDTAEKISSELEANDPNKSFFDMTVDRIQERLSRLASYSETNDREIEELIRDLQENLNTRIKTIIEKVESLHFESIAMLEHDKDLSSAWKNKFEEIYSKTVE